MTASLIERRRLGRTAVTVPVVGMGCSPLGNRGRILDSAAAGAAIRAALDAGMSYFDTAPYYGFGLSERRVGDALRDVPKDRYVLSTKVGRLLVADDRVDTGAARSGFLSPMPFMPVFDYSYAGIMRSFDDSRHRLGLAQIDILLVHDLGSFAHGGAHDARFRQFVGGGLRALSELRSGGAIRAFGLGVNETAVCEQLLDFTDIDCFLVAGRYTLLDQSALASLLPRCLKSGTSILLGGPYNSGLLAGGSRRTGTLKYDYQPASPSILQRLHAVEAVCEMHGVPIAAAALQFPLAHPALSAVLPGIGSATRVAETLQWLQHEIPPSFWQTLKERQLLPASAPVPGCC